MKSTNDDGHMNIAKKISEDDPFVLLFVRKCNLNLALSRSFGITVLFYARCNLVAHVIVQVVMNCI